MNTYQLNVELQVRSTNEDARSVESNFLIGLSTWLHSNAPWATATVSAIKCARTHKFDEAQFSQSDAKWVNESIDVIALLVEDEADGGFGEFNNPVRALVTSRWPNVTDWECGQVTYHDGVVTLHDLYVVE